MKRFNSNKVRALGNLIPLTASQKAANKREFLKAQRPVTKPSDDPKFIAPYAIKLGKRTRQGFNGCKLNPVVRAEIERRRALNAAFHAELRRGLV